MTMTRNEAIQILDNERNAYIIKGCQLDKAIDMAIEALKNEPVPCEKCIHVKSCRKVILLKDRRYKLIRYCSKGVERKKP